MTVESQPDLSECAKFAASLRGDRIRSERAVRRALHLAGQRSRTTAIEELTVVARPLDGTLGSLDRAAEELRLQSEALFAARTEPECLSAFFHDPFARAPSVYLRPRKLLWRAYVRVVTDARLARVLTGHPGGD